MIVGLVLFVVGILLIVSHPILGFIPGLLLIVIGIVAMVLGGFARGASALLRMGTTKTCPECKSAIPMSATVCRYCNHPFQ
jgi:ribosomal protein L40E